MTDIFKDANLTKSQWRSLALVRGKYLERYEEQLAKLGGLPIELGDLMEDEETPKARFSKLNKFFSFMSSAGASKLVEE